MTPEQIKNSIDQSVTNKTGQAKSITPNILGGVLKSIIDFSTSFFTPKSEKSQPNGIATLDENGKVPSEQLPEMNGGETPPSANTNIHRFPKDASLTEAHIGLLAMQQINFLNFPPLSPEDLEIKAVLANTTPGTPEVLGEFEIELKGFFELDKTTITSNWDNNWQLKYVDYYSGSASISFEYLFMALKGNPYGTDDGSGFLGFADNTEKINALTWCLSNNNNNNEQSITDKFDVVTPFYYDAISESFKIVLRQKEIPGGSTYWQYNGSVPGTQANATTTVQSAKVIFEQVKSTILGTIVGIDGSDVLIDTSPVQTLRMASTEDGAFGILPLPMLEDNEELGLYLLFPWRNGRVIDYNGLAMNHNINPFGIREEVLINENYYKPLTSALPDEPVLAKN